MWPSLSAGMRARPSQPFGRIYNVLMMAARHTLLSTPSGASVDFCWAGLRVITQIAGHFTHYVQCLCLCWEPPGEDDWMSQVLTSLFFGNYSRFVRFCPPAVYFWSQMSLSQKPLKGGKKKMISALRTDSRLSNDLSLFNDDSSVTPQ